MKQLIFMLPVIFWSLSVHAQGGWNIGYITVDSINQSHIGLPIQLDFKHQNASKFDASLLSIRQQIMPEDTAYVQIDSSTFELIEQRFIYADQGFFEDQFLAISTSDQANYLRINETKLLEFNESQLLVQITIHTYKKSDLKIEQIIRTTQKQVLLNRQQLDGLLFRIN